MENPGELTVVRHFAASRRLVAKERRLHLAFASSATGPEGESAIRRPAVVLGLPTFVCFFGRVHFDMCSVSMRCAALSEMPVPSLLVVRKSARIPRSQGLGKSSNGTQPA